MIVGKTDYTTPPASLARDVMASFETVRLDPQPQGLLSKWSFVRLTAVTPAYGTMLEASRIGAAARSERAERQQRASSPLAASAVTVQEPPMAVVGFGTLAETATLVGPANESPSLAAQVAAEGGSRVVEAYEVVA